MNPSISDSNSRTKYWDIVSSLLNNGQNVFLAMVAEHTPHSPGTTGAKLLVAKECDPVGTIGGGIMEYNLVKRAKDILEIGSFTPEIQPLSHQKSGEGEKSGMICAGQQTNLYYLCRPEKDGETVARICHALNQNQSAVLSIDSSGLDIRAQKHDDNKAQIELSKDGHDWIYKEQLQNIKRIALMGGGHCSLALSRVMNQLGYDVCVFDTRNNVSTVGENKYANSVQIVNDYRDAAEIINYPELTQVVVMTTDVDSDVRGLLGVLKRHFPFIGVMGSDAKISEIKKRLKNEGISEDQLFKLTSPVGIPMASKTPEEIAISVAAQILQIRNQDAK
jgi:xanthine dehydrogenase accessory factor